MQRNHCNCPVNTLQRIAGRLNQDTLPVDDILQIGTELAGHFSTIIHCERCITTKRTTGMLSQITSRLVSFYEAAFLSAAASLTSSSRRPSVNEASFLSTPPLSRNGEASTPLPTAMQGVSGYLNDKIQEWKLVADALLEAAEEQYDEVIL
ncbi:hypothetical protein ACRALDRAFT_1067834 [Sodiomyces alcalophilus JCM 7366]|uniref:uncharacterized protein n=1 Tax=Sodiomyces alcalophilus JCM 7366 TaxID=591952 RepID=UPI0039B5F94F